MKSTVKVAKTVDEAVKLAIEELNCSKEEAVIEVIEEPKSGIFGLFGAKDAMVRVSCEEDIGQLLNEVISDNSSKVDTEVKKETKSKEVFEKENKKEIDKDSNREVSDRDLKTKEVEKFEEVSSSEESTKPVEVDEEFKSKVREFLNSVVEKMGIESNCSKTLL